MSAERCSIWWEVIVRYAVDLLSPEKAAPLVKHLEKCNRCKTLLAKLRPQKESLLTLWGDKIHDDPEWWPSDEYDLLADDEADEADDATTR